MRMCTGYLLLHSLTELTCDFLHHRRLTRQPQRMVNYYSLPSSFPSSNPSSLPLSLLPSLYPSFPPTLPRAALGSTDAAHPASLPITFISLTHNKDFLKGLDTHLGRLMGRAAPGPFFYFSVVRSFVGVSDGERPADGLWRAWRSRLHAHNTDFIIIF